MFKRWLSKEERKTLNRQQRRALRKQLRKEAREAGELWHQKLFERLELDHSVIVQRDKLDEAIIEAIKEVDDLEEDLSPYARLDAIIDIVVDAVDEFVDLSQVKISFGIMSWPVGVILEKYDAPFIKWALEGVITRMILARLEDPDAPEVDLKLAA